MSKSLVVVLAVLGLMSSLAFAAPKMLSDASLDKVAAGTSVFDYIFGGGEAAVTTAQLPADAAAAEGGSIAINGTNNRAALAEDQAIAGNNNNAVNGDYSVALRNNNDNNAFAFGDYSAALGRNNDDNGIALGERNVGLGDSNDDNLIITGDYSGGGYVNGNSNRSANAFGIGNIAVRTAELEDSNVIVGDGNGAIGDFDDNTDSFAVAGNDNCTIGIIDNDDSLVVVGDNNTAKYTTVDVTITDSFNVTTNTVDISGQCELTAIVNANSLSLQGIGVNLTITNAAASVPTVQGDVALSVPIIAGNALAVSVLQQANVNNSIFVNVGPGSININ